MKHARLLVADAHQNMLEGVRQLVAGLFEAVVMVADEDSLVQMAATLKPDLIIVDLSLPVSGTKNVLRRLHALDLAAPAKIVVLSIHDEVEAVCEAMAAGALGFVLKRSAATDLIPAIQEVLCGRVYVSPGVQADSSAAVAD